MNPIFSSRLPGWFCMSRWLVSRRDISWVAVLSSLWFSTILGINALRISRPISLVLPLRRKIGRSSDSRYWAYSLPYFWRRVCIFRLRLYHASGNWRKYLRIVTSLISNPSSSWVINCCWFGWSHLSIPFNLSKIAQEYSLVLVESRNQRVVGFSRRII